jgi:two-component system, response regulator
MFAALLSKSQVSRTAGHLQLLAHTNVATDRRRRIATRRPFMPKKLILLVEDNADDELLTLDALRSGGVTSDIVVVRDGMEALAYLLPETEQNDESHVPQLVLLDLKLPKVSGLEVLRRLRQDDRTKFVPIVVLTSSSQDSDMEKAYSSGANSYVRKPVEFDRFLEAVRCLGLFWIPFNEVPAHA